MFSNDNTVYDGGLTSTECIEWCNDPFRKPPVIVNPGQSYRKMKQYGYGTVCFGKCSSLNPVSCIDVIYYWNYTAAIVLLTPYQTINNNYGCIINYQPSIAAMVINNIIKEVIKWRSCVHPVGAPWAIATLGVDFPVKWELINTT